MKVYLTAALLHLFCCAVAQTGPGGVGNATTNVLWLSADEGVYSNTAGTTPAANGNNVAVWADRSGNGNNATHGTATERPDFRTGVRNGLPVIRFTAANGDRLLSTGLATANRASVFAIASWSSLPSMNPGIIQGAPAGSGFSTSPGEKSIGMWVADNGGNEVWGRGVQSNGTSVDIPKQTGTNTGTFYSFLNLYGASSIIQYVNNGTAGTANYNGTLNDWSDFGIGRQAGESWNGDIAEVIVFNIAVNSAQRTIINNYLAAKYGLTLAAGEVYTMDNPGNGNYDYEVAGIGRVDASNIHNDAQGSGILRISNPTSLGNGDYLMWGHDNGSMNSTTTAGIPAGVTARFNRVWGVSEIGNVGGIDMEFDLTGNAAISGLSACDAALSLRLLVDTDNNGSFETLVSGATNVGGGVYRFSNVTAIGNQMRFALAMLSPATEGPAGVGTVDGTSSLKLWFRIDNGLNVSGTAVDSWVNSAGIPALDVSEAGAQRPSAIAGAVNGFSEISFNGGNRLRTGLTLTTSNFVTDEASSYVVNRADNTTQMSSVYLTDPLDVNRFSNHIPWSGTVYFDIGNCCGTDARLDVGGLTGLNGYSVWSYDANPSTGKQLYRNGSLLLNRAGTSTYSSHATQRFNIGGNITGSAGYQGDVTEIIIFNAKVNSAQRILIENYLAAKYGLTLSANDVYQGDNGGNGNYDYDVAGIGRVNSTNFHDDSKGTGIVRVYNPSNLGDNEFFMWGHDNGSVTTINTVDVPAGVQGRLQRVWRVSETTNVGNLDIMFDLTDFGPITASDLRLLIDHNGNGSFSDPGTLAISGAIAQSCNRYLFVGVPGGAGGLTDGDHFTIGSINLVQTPLPIQLAAFTGDVVEGDVLLRWTTLSETNNKSFSIERSSDGTHFMNVGEVTGAGTTRQKKTYSYEDSFAPYGVLYYRLKQADFDGAYSYSDVIRVEIADAGTELIASPNPLGDREPMTLRIRHTEMVDMTTVKVHVYDIMGREVPVAVLESEAGKLRIQFAEGHPGVYILTASSKQLQAPLVTRVLIH